MSSAEKIVHFSSLPISQETKRGLLEFNFSRMTAIQQQSIIPALEGEDILGCAKTGSGKTLCFLIPVLFVVLFFILFLRFSSC
jgi:superfamily II DNA/RNA helicase